MKSKDISIRKAKPSDHDDVIIALQNWWGGRDLSAMLPKLFLNHFDDTSLVIEKEGQMIGFLIGFMSPGLKNEAYVHFMGVHPDFRKAGLGNQLLTSVEMEARRNGIHQLFILTTHSSHWFLEHGFIDDSLDILPPQKRQSYNVDRQSLVMSKRLDR